MLFELAAAGGAVLLVALLFTVHQAKRWSWPSKKSGQSSMGCASSSSSSSAS